MKYWIRAVVIFLGLLVGLCLISLRPGTVIYGTFAGECKGNCATMYEIKNDTITRDTTSFFQSWGETKFTIQPQQKQPLNASGDLSLYSLKVPLIMLLEPRGTFGCPDCSDQGGYYLQFKLLGITRRFRIDKEYEPFYWRSLTEDIDKSTDNAIKVFTK